MAKGSKSRSSANATPSSLTSLLSPAPTPAMAINDPIILNQLYHGRYDDPSLDLRVYHPDAAGRSPPSPYRSANRIVTWKNLRATRLNLPHLVGICVRRKVRREVLFALNLHARGRGTGRRRTRFSKVHC